MNRHWLATAFFFALLLLILYGAFLILSPFLKAITWAAILAVLVYPVYDWLLRRLRGRATAAALIVIVLITLIVVLPGLRLAGFLSEEAVELVQTVRSLMNGDGLEAWKEKSWVQEVVRLWGLLSFELAAFQIDWKEVLLQGAQFSSGFLVTQVKGIAQNLFLFVINFMIALFTLFFFLRDGKNFFHRVRRLLPMDQEYQDRLFDNIVNSIFGVVHGLVLVAMLQGILAGLAYWVLGVPFSVLWGATTAFAALLPVGGSTLVTVPASIYLFLQGEALRGTVLLVWSLAIVGSVDNILKPYFIGNRLKLPMLLLFFGILGGLALFGALGLILGPVLFALLAALLDLYIEEYAGANQERSDP